MAPTQTRKRKSNEMATPEAVTPTGSPAVKKMRITQSQKQALIDNLQLEITERARRLRAQYAIQCQDLRSRIERRVHRIPVAMREVTMGELMAKYEETKKPTTTAAKVEERPLPPPPQSSNPHPPSPVRQQQTQTQLPRSRKRKTSEIHIAMDKENEDEPKTTAPEALPVSKNTKRAKTTTAASKAGRTASRTQKTRSSKEPAGVLSPRSHNSRTLPRSPIKDLAHPLSPTKVQNISYIARPISPLKPNSPLKSAAMATTSAISASVHGMIQRATQGTKANRTASKEHAANTRAASAQSNHSVDTQSSTTSTNTVVTKSKRGLTSKTTSTTTTKMAPPTTTARGKATNTTTTTASKAAGTAKTALRKAASVTTKKVVVAEPAAGRRVLRKRN